MAVNLINMLQSEFPDDVIGRIASFVGEKPASTKSAIGYAGPALLGMLAHKSQTPEGAADIFGLLQRGGFTGANLGSAGSFFRSGAAVGDAAKAGIPLVSTLFGARRSEVTDSIASSAGVSPQSSGSILGALAPLVMGLLGREATAAGGFNASSVARLLGEQWPYLRGLSLPGLSGLLGMTGVEEPARAYETPRAEPARAYTQAVRTEPARAYDRPGGMGWLKWAIPLLLLALGIWALAARRHEPRQELTAAAVPPTIGTAGRVGLVPRRLSCGQELQVAPNGVESRLIDYIDNGSQSMDRETWLTFDRLEFETGSANLRPSSQAQLENISAILNCYRNVHLKIGGYTDNVGDAAANMRLSQARAENTRQAIVAHGIEGSRLEAEGYGDQHPVASNDTEEGRQQNRRIDVRVTQK